MRPSFHLTKDLASSSVGIYIESLRTLNIRNLQNRPSKDKTILISFNNGKDFKVEKNWKFGCEASSEYQDIGSLESSVCALGNIDRRSLQNQRDILFEQIKKEIGSRQVNIKSL